MGLLARLTVVMLCALTLVGCAGDQSCRPCGPGILGNMTVPQGFHGVDMRPACHGHDACYTTCGSDRKCCDDVFLAEMDCRCECSPNPVRCRMKARQWYLMTRLFGGYAHRVSQQDCQCCCE